MILLNTSFYIEDTDELSFLKWIRGTYIPAARMAGYDDLKMLRLPQQEESTRGYGVQFCMPSVQEAVSWRDRTLPEIVEATSPVRAPRVMYFTSIMEIMDA